MKTKSDIVKNWLPRYTGRPLTGFGRYILLANFSNYIELFAERFGAEIVGRDKPMQSVTANDITIMNFGMGSSLVCQIMDRRFGLLACRRNEPVEFPLLEVLIETPAFHLLHDLVELRPRHRLVHESLAATEFSKIPGPILELGWYR